MGFIFLTLIESMYKSTWAYLSW